LITQKGRFAIPVCGS